jgi:hypothetical protein
VRQRHTSSRSTEWRFRNKSPERSHTRPLLVVHTFNGTTPKHAEAALSHFVIG